MITSHVKRSCTYVRACVAHGVGCIRILDIVLHGTFEVEEILKVQTGIGFLRESTRYIAVLVNEYRPSCKPAFHDNYRETLVCRRLAKAQRSRACIVFVLSVNESKVNNFGCDVGRDIDASAADKYELQCVVGRIAPSELTEILDKNVNILACVLAPCVEDERIADLIFLAEP